MRTLVSGAGGPERDGKNPLSLNRGHPETMFRLRVGGLQPRTTYYSELPFSVGDSHNAETTPVKLRTLVPRYWPTLASVHERASEVGAARDVLGTQLKKAA